MNLPCNNPKKHFTPGKHYTSGSIIFVANERGDLIRVTPCKRDLRAQLKHQKTLRKVVEDNNTHKETVDELG